MFINVSGFFFFFFSYEEGCHKQLNPNKIYIFDLSFGIFFSPIFINSSLKLTFCFLLGLATSKSWPLHNRFHLFQLPNWCWFPHDRFLHQKYGECQIDVIIAITNIIECLLCVRHCSKDFILINSLTIKTALWRSTDVPILSVRKLRHRDVTCPR